MAGLLILGGAAAYVALWWFVISKARNRGERVSAVVIALLIPFWDLPFGYFNFYRLCSQEGGLHVDKELRAADSILLAESTAYRPEDVLKLGFKTVEFMSRGQVIRYSSSPAGVLRTTHTQAISPLVYEFSSNKPLPWNVVRSDYEVKRIGDGKILARQTDFGWNGMWWESNFRVQVTSARHCSGVPSKSVLLVLAEGAG